jgi:hypothetical protein
MRVIEYSGVEVTGVLAMQFLNAIYNFPIHFSSCIQRNSSQVCVRSVGLQMLIKNTRLQIHILKHPNGQTVRHAQLTAHINSCVEICESALARSAHTRVARTLWLKASFHAARAAFSTHRDIEDGSGPSAIITVATSIERHASRQFFIHK